MKNLSEFIYESLVFEAADTTDEQKYMIKSLSKNKDLKNYVKYLEAMLEDDDARNVLLKAFFNSTSKDAYKFNVKIHALPILQLHPTQNEIDIDNSLGFPFSGGKKNQDENRKMCVNNFYGSKKKDPEMTLGFPLITFNGKYIIDGILPPLLRSPCLREHIVNRFVFPAAFEFASLLVLDKKGMLHSKELLKFT